MWFSSQRTTDPDGRFAFDCFLPAGSDAEGGLAWRLVCAGAFLELDPLPGGAVEDLRVEVSITREGR